MSEISIEQVKSDTNVLRAKITCSPDLRMFFSGEDFLVEYDTSIDDVPDSILVLPVLAQVCPVAWTQNADVRVPTVDSRFAASLLDVRDTLMQLYPKFVLGGNLRYKELEERNPAGEFEETGLLFTGGVDSTYSFIQHRDEDPALITIQGWTVVDVEFEKWNGLKGHVEAFGTDHGADNYFVRSNRHSLFNVGMLKAQCEPYVDGAWYSSVGHGVGLLGMCAPLAYANGIGDLYMAATHWNGISLPWGSNPSIVENVAWAGTRCHHDGYEITRQERLEAVADYVREENPGLELRTCNETVAENCGDCEKCYRTAVGMFVAGLDPSDHGYPLDVDSFDEIPRKFERREWPVGNDERIMWEDLQTRVSPDVNDRYEEAQAFFDWMLTTDFSKYMHRPQGDVTTQLLQFAYRNAPDWTYDVMYPLYRYVKKRRRRQRLQEMPDGHAPGVSYSETAKDAEPGVSATIPFITKER